MSNSLKKTIKHILGSFLVFIITTSLQSQNALSNSEDQSSIPDIEKIYLHTDRSYYNLGESIWYKAYLVYAYNNLLFDHSNILYVELISPNSKIIARNKIRLEAGLGHGDFKLTDSIGVKPGKYQIRAYTNWMRNFGEDFVFSKEIEILDVFEKNKVRSEGGSAQTTQNKSLNEATKNAINVQFFPEGGSLVEDVMSVVAFKSVDANGDPIDVKGKVFNDNGELVSQFGSLHDGMGKFLINPTKGESYYAKITNLHGEEILEIPLPKAKDQGYLISAVNVRGKEMISIRTNEVTIANYKSAPVKIVCLSRGVSYYEGSQPLSQTSITFELPIEKFPDGITQITLYDVISRPQSERLVYIEKEHNVNVTLNTKKNIYKPKEKVTVSISSKTTVGDAVPASFSLSSIDMNGMDTTDDFGINICSYFLMESDIRGKVHNPGFYFDHSNSRRHAYLDLLLLTQGWRDFLWKEMPKIDYNQTTYIAEKGITISGIVKQIDGNTPKPNNSVLLNMFNKGKMRTLTGITDSQGEFKFENLVFMGKTTMMLNTQNENKKERGMFELDSVVLPPMAITFKADSTTTSKNGITLKENIYRKNISFGITGENVLDEVEIIAKKKSEAPQSLYGTPDHIYVIDEKTPDFSSIYLLIQFKIPGIIVSGDAISFFGNRGAAQTIVDGVPIDGDISFIHPDDVAKIESMNGASASIFGSNGVNGVILIYLKEGVLNRRSKTKVTPHSITKQIEGLYESRVFYSPNPNEPSFEMNNDAAVRNTLYWNPYVHPNETGHSEVSYFNSEVETTVKVSLEGITASGIPVVVITNYDIKR